MESITDGSRVVTLKRFNYFKKIDIIISIRQMEERLSER